LNTVTTVKSFKLVDLATLRDSVSLVCNYDGDFCGEKEFVLEYESKVIPFDSLPEGWVYSSATRILSIDPLTVTKLGSFTLFARLKEFPNQSTVDSTTKTIFNLIERADCKIKQIFAIQPYLKYFYALG